MSIPIYTAKELAAKVFPKPAWLMEPFLQRGGDWLIAGEPDSFKSTFLLQACIHASLGLDYLFLRIDSPLRIVYINIDDNARLIQKRLREMTPKGQTLNENFFLACQPAIEFDPAGVEGIKKLAHELTPDIVILDHLTNLVVGGTSDSRGMQEYNKLQKWLCSQDIGVAAITHLNRSTKDNKEDKPLRRIAGCNQIIGVHSVISVHEALEQTIGHKFDRARISMERNKHTGENPDWEVELVKNEEHTFLREVQL